MKITKIEITDFHQFKDLTIDLTYPKGHEKEGKPLDKICFIGQSGTGKTTLLELIPKFLYDYNTPTVIYNSEYAFANRVKFSIEFGDSPTYAATLSFGLNEKEYYHKRKWDNLFSNNFPTRSEDVINYYKEIWIRDIASKLIYFPAKLNYEIESDYNGSFNEKAVIDFSKENVAVVWNLILEQIQSYQEQELQIRQEVSRTVQQSTINLENVRQAVQKLEEWKSREFNPVQDIADNCLNKLLAPLKLRVKTELDIKSKEEIGFIKIEDFSGNEIPNGLWSTGTKQIILSALPLYLLKPKHTVILFDEPERSLYPDMQRFMIDYYQSLTENCQFFYSTHSPIIASEFEPWEIVELKFSDEGKVYRELYYPKEEENHVDNYIVDPRFLNYDLILSKVFDVKAASSETRTKGIMELTMLKNKLEKLKSEKNLKSEEGKQTFKEYQNLATKLSWPNQLIHAKN